MSYMLTVATALMRGSILAALITKLPLPQTPSGADAFPVDERLGAQVVDGGAEVFGVDVRRDRVARLAFAFAPERQIQRHGDEALFGHLAWRTGWRSAP